ncbi:hypothetical protein UFOVP228_23 [uncultured Caudovirales phage]|uniref:Uncharacterized protein n=1 Tax=uncultured Caudovirales phage TaxID=2100421 RepID=A0A6J7WV18_9CAUD|nr:hypothetical protein UFOVP47_79 [uncultured Caudovirales phage]CAB5219083.1 hypothetical protein UFOVP228_23 [uncultured Caudovirales phage]
MNIATERGFQDALKWTRHQLGMLNDGGVWVVPRSMTAIRVISRRKLEAEMIGMKREPEIVGMMRALGWQVREAQAV